MGESIFDVKVFLLERTCTLNYLKSGLNWIHFSFLNSSVEVSLSLIKEDYFKDNKLNPPTLTRMALLNIPILAHLTNHSVTFVLDRFVALTTPALMDPSAKLWVRR